LLNSRLRALLVDRGHAPARRRGRRDAGDLAQIDAPLELIAVRELDDGSPTLR
jgi:hypothetical protein